MTAARARPRRPSVGVALIAVAVTRGTAPLTLTQMRAAAGVGQARSWSAGVTDSVAAWPAGTVSVISTTASGGLARSGRSAGVKSFPSRSSVTYL